MKRVLFEFPGFDQGRLFSADARDHVSEPFIYLRDRMRLLGYDLTTADQYAPREAHAVWFWDVPATAPSGPIRAGLNALRPLAGKPRDRDLLGDCLRADMDDRLTLFLGEPPVVVAGNGDQSRWSEFRTVLTWRDDLVDGRRILKFVLPLPADHPTVPEVPFRDRRLLVNITANKHSTHPSELYSSRLALIRYCERVLPDDFELYGVGWANVGDSFPSYRGAPRHKWDVYPQFKFGICYENTDGLPGYVSEKIFDCMRAAAVPVYLGAPNISEYVAPEAYVDRRDFVSDEDLVRFLRAVDEQTYAKYREAARDYLAGDRFARFLPPAFADNVIAHARL